jgi:hypothetical protein
MEVAEIVFDVELPVSGQKKVTAEDAQKEEDRLNAERERNSKEN